jgi:hypothetical protein
VQNLAILATTESDEESPGLLGTFLLGKGTSLATSGFFKEALCFPKDLWEDSVTDSRERIEFSRLSEADFGCAFLGVLPEMESDDET